MIISPHTCHATASRVRSESFDQGVLSMDGAFVQAPEHRPMPAIGEADGIPVIDLSPLAAGDEAGLEALAAEVGRACRDWGFFVAVRHGVPPEKVARAMEAQRAIYALPADRKALRGRAYQERLNHCRPCRRTARRDVGAPLGYYEAEHTKNVRDWKEVFDLAAHEPPPAGVADHGGLVFQNKWPRDLPELRAAFEEYGEAMEELALKLLELRPDRMHGFFSDPQTTTTFIRLNHDPPCPNPELALGVGRHKDSGALAILHQDDVGGLDVKRRTDGEWVRVRPVKDSLVVNVGDIVQVWSNDRYESTEHRVSVNAEKERFSMPYFFNPGSGTIVEPLEELVSAESPARYHGYNWGEFFSTRKNSNFRKLGVENIQIAHFRKDLPVTGLA